MTIRPNKQGIFPAIRRGQVQSVALGNGTQYGIAVLTTPGGLFVAVESKGAYSFYFPPDPEYLMSKMPGLDNESDAKNLTDFIVDQMGFTAMRARRGHYYDQFCLEEAAP